MQIFGKIGWSVYHIRTSRQIDATRAKVYLSDPGLIGLKVWESLSRYERCQNIEFLRRLGQIARKSLFTQIIADKI